MYIISVLIYRGRIYDSLGPRNPKALREAAESSQRIDLVSAQMEARYRKKTPDPIPIEIATFDANALARGQY
ncbi:hypothetical protein ACAW74_25855 [Fibrella sp. WM1]|uniref:hypothetical protein n=1 Tax=Fibrella musci TaxID=3242485 RepID=UPI00352310E8